MVFEEGLFEAGFVAGLECPKVGGQEGGYPVDGVVVGEVINRDSVLELSVPAVDAYAFPLKWFAEKFWVATVYLA